MADLPQVTEEAETSYKPSAFYFRRAIRGARTKAQAQEAGLHAVREMEALKAWVREQGMIPPKRFVLADEAAEKGWECRPGA